MTPWWRRQKTQPAPEHRADPLKTAMLEQELLGIQPEPGTPIAAAVAAARPVDPDRCPHENVIDISGIDDPRPVGMCQHCGAQMVRTDEGEWTRP